MKAIKFITLLFVNVIFGQFQKDYQVHSHNDYLQNVPFWKAISAGSTSIEADVFLIDGSLLVAHTKEELSPSRSFSKLYLEPLIQYSELGLQNTQKLQVLIDIKSEAYTTLDAVVAELKEYPSLTTNTDICFVISGNRPKPSEYLRYPDFIHFDYQSLDDISDKSLLEKIGLISLSFRDFSDWNGKGRLLAEDRTKITAVIAKAHSFNKPFRFWATPDSKTAWKAFTDLGVDFLNTDRPFECVAYVSTLHNREFQNTTFSEVFRPTFESDGKNFKPQNIILLIGDGNGLTQISATAFANNGELSVTQLKNIGFLKTQSSDDFTTDSAGAATAMATGHKVPNRYIGVDSLGNSIPNITEILAENGFISGLVTTDEITGATPGAFYAHQKDRSMSESILKDLWKSNLSLAVSAGGSAREDWQKSSDFKLLESSKKLALSSENKVSLILKNTSKDKEMPLPLYTAVSDGLSFLKRKKMPFFLLVEGAKIDSYGHANDIAGVVMEGISFDKAVTEALKFADDNGNTLVLITADHETGGLAIPQGNLIKNEIEGDFTTDDHTGTMIPIFAYGPRSDMFQGVYENNLLFSKILRAFEVTVQK